MLKRRSRSDHCRDNISDAIESDMSNFGGSSHLRYQSIRLLRKEEMKGAWYEHQWCGTRFDDLPRIELTASFTGFLRGAALGSGYAYLGLALRSVAGESA
jgi:hypothetical protein